MEKIFFLFFVTTVCLADEPARPQPDIFRPCRLDNYKCIRDHLAANSHCSKNVVGFIPNTYTVNEFTFETPAFNSSNVDRYLVVKNHNRCRVIEYFINRRTNRVVIGVECYNLDLESDRILIQHQSLREDALYFFHIHSIYPLVRMTAILDGRNNMDLCKARVFTEVPVLPRNVIDPQDEPTENFLSRDLSMLNIFERESFFYGGERLAKRYIDDLICNFGCPRLAQNYTVPVASLPEDKSNN